MLVNDIEFKATWLHSKTDT